MLGVGASTGELHDRTGDRDCSVNVARSSRRAADNSLALAHIHMPIHFVEGGRAHETRKRGTRGLIAD